MKISLSKSQGKLVNDVIKHWERNNLIHDELKDKLTESIEIRSFEWKKLAKYSFIVSIICIAISFSTIIADKLLIQLLENIVAMSNSIICLFFSVLAGIFYIWACHRKRKMPLKVFSNEFILVLGVLSTATAIAFLGKALDNGSGHYSLLILFATFVYATIGLLFPSRLVWLFAILCLGAWFGTETAYVSFDEAYFLGMNYPLRFVIFGIALSALSFVFAKSKHLKTFRNTTFEFGLMYLFLASWILSIFGNYGNIYDWEQVKQTELFGWGLLFALFAIAAILYGLKYDNQTSRSYGISFLLLNLYTRYFEYFWDSIHKTLFFLILAISFYIIGRNAEKIWHLQFIKQKEIKEE